ncbi:hypothetical protein PWE30_02150 [Shigella dysenteriae]|uniref:hypothetical protein n=1 Tax=Shigella dysenteriae TaxID=622 RepID=UPI0010086877|nr:hypothetical protein [Shigella dysenteriae]WNT69020.1 hypothetical protein PWE30_02150 [Shigella dysenteriae]
MRAEIALMSGSAFAVTHHAFSSGAGRTSDGNGSHASTLKSPSYTKSVSWQHYLNISKLFIHQHDDKSRMSQTSGEQICFKVPVSDLVQSGFRLAYPPGS